MLRSTPSALQAVRVALEWRNLTYTVTVGRGKKATSKTILDRVSGVAPPGHLLAIMGPTGADRVFGCQAHLARGALCSPACVRCSDR